MEAFEKYKTVRRFCWGILGAVFLYGMYSANHDVECIFIDGILKRDHIKAEDMPKFVERLKGISAQCGIDFYVSISADKSELSDVDLTDCKVLN